MSWDVLLPKQTSGQPFVIDVDAQGNYYCNFLFEDANGNEIDFWIEDIETKKILLYPGQLATGTTKIYLKVQPNLINKKRGSAKIASPDMLTGYNHTFILTELGEVFVSSTGGEPSGFDDSFETKYDFTQIKKSIEGKIKKRLELSGTDVLYLTSDNHLFNCGYNYQKFRDYGDRELMSEEKNKLPIGEIIVDVAGRGYHNIVVMDSGRVFAIGENTNGELADGTGIDQTDWVEITSQFPDKIVKVETGRYNSFFLSENSKIYASGNLTLVPGSSVDALSPVDITSYFNGEIIKDISSTGSIALFLTQSNKIYGLGDNGYYQFGTGDTTDLSLPTDLTSYLNSEVPEKIKTYENNIAVITTSGKLFVAGDNSNGKLGLGNDTTLQDLTDITPYFNGGLILDVSIDDTHALFVTQDYKVFGAGLNDYGQLGTNDTIDSMDLVEVTNNFPQNIKEVYTAKHSTYSFSYFIDINDNIYSVGSNNYGTLGDYGETKKINMISSAFHEEKIVAVSSGQDHSSAITETGKLYTWGWNQYGQLGDGTTTNKSTPTLIDAFNGEKIVAVSLGASHSSAITETGKLYIWGYNYYGQLGDGTTTNISTPTLIDSFGGEKVVAVSLGYYHSSAITETGKLYTWGLNNYGRLGDGTTTQRNTPTLIDAFGGEKIVSVSLGTHHSSAITETGKLYTWGFNNYGQLGDGTTTQRNTPTLIDAFGGEKIVSVSLGGYHSSAITETGKLYTWGYNNNGELGDGTTTSRTTPTLIDSFGGEKIVAVSLGRNHSSAITETGKLYIWGYNGYGQLGIGTTDSDPHPTPILIPNVVSSRIFEQTVVLNEIAKPAT